MVIDIIEYTGEQLASLKKAELRKVRAAQEKKNALTKEYGRKSYEEKLRLTDRGIFRSDLWNKRETELAEELAAEIAAVRESLLFDLHYAEGSAEIPSDLPYEADYSLSAQERMLVVKAYYEEAYTDAQERFDAFVADEFAKTYLGEYYASLYYYFQDAL